MITYRKSNTNCLVLGWHLSVKQENKHSVRIIIKEKDGEQASARLQHFIPAEHTPTIASLFLYLFFVVVLIPVFVFVFADKALM